ncbi:hypothetical protein DPMN_031267 [Dreissena polymorpha]|uniref:Uncharacterized protein n=1 Tax=Dreissena polymorpha TaxID=45954 RepID=A0A9D4RIX0_DREPO|nr:hypothetical protein DPMN_031267 [Dreissena polymorpha]
MMSTDAHFTPPSGPWTRLPHHSQHQEPIINSLNIPDTYIHSIMTPQDHLFAPTEVTSAPSQPLRTTSETIKESATNQLKTTVTATYSTTTILTATSTPLKDQTTPTEPPTTLQRTPASSPCPSSSTSLRSPTPISLDDKTHTSSTHDSGNCTAESPYYNPVSPDQRIPPTSATPSYEPEPAQTSPYSPQHTYHPTMT